jgi:uncharacterized membrane protein YphA (DoxX/SURF4 family)
VHHVIFFAFCCHLIVAILILHERWGMAVWYNILDNDTWYPKLLVALALLLATNLILYACC